MPSKPAPVAVVDEYSVVVVPPDRFIFSRLRLFCSSAKYLVSFSAAVRLEAPPTPAPVPIPVPVPERPVPVMPELVVLEVVVVPVREAP